MFSDADKWQQNLIESTLKTAGYSTYAGMNDGIEVAAVMADATRPLKMPANEVAEIVTFVHKIVFALDVYQLAKRCNSVVFTINEQRARRRQHLRNCDRVRNQHTRGDFQDLTHHDAG